MINPPQVLPEEPTAVTPHGGFCGGKSQQWLRYPTDPNVWFGGRGDPNQSVLPTPINPPPPPKFATIATPYWCRKVGAEARWTPGFPPG